MSLTKREVQLKHGHPERSCLHNKNWHMTFSRELTKEEWSAVSAGIDLDLRCFDKLSKKWDAVAIGDVVHAIASDITMEVTYA